MKLGTTVLSLRLFFLCRDPTTGALVCEGGYAADWPAPCHLPQWTSDSIQARSRWRKMSIVIDHWRQGLLDSREKEHRTRAPAHTARDFVA